MQQNRTRIYNPRSNTDNLTTLRFEHLQRKLKSTRLKSFSILKEMRLIVRKGSVDSTISLRKTDTARFEEALNQAIETGNPLVDYILLLKNVIVNQEKVIDRKNKT